MMWQGEEETVTPYKYSIPNGLFMLFFCSWYYMVDDDRSLLMIDTSDNGSCPISHTTDSLNSFFWTVVMRHDTQVGLNNYWSMTEQLLTQLYSKAAMWHIPAHSFMPSISEQSHYYWQWDRLWQTMEIKPYFWYAKQYLLKILCPFQTWLGVMVVVVAALYLQKVRTQEAQTFGTEIYKLCGIEWIYLYMCTCLGKDRTCDYTWCWLSDT